MASRAVGVDAGFRVPLVSILTIRGTDSTLGSRGEQGVVA